MKKRILQSLLFLVVMASLTIPLVIPEMKQGDIIETNVAANTESTELIKEDIKGVNVYAGVTAQLNKYMNTKIDKSPNKCLVIKKKIAWTTSRINVRDKPSLDGNVVKVLDFNTRIEYLDLDNTEWVRLITNNNKHMYINSNYLSKKKCDYQEVLIPSNSGFKSWMSYKAITTKSSPQYKLQHNFAYTGNYGIRQVDGRYCVAIGTAFGVDVGTYIDLVLSNGEVISCIVGDIKADIHTESNNIVTASNGCVSEFIVCVNSLNSNAKRDGDISSCKKKWNSPVDMIRVYNKNILK